MLEIAKNLKAKGYVVALVTDNKSDRVESISKQHKFDELFDDIVISDTIGSGKKEQKIFDETLGKLKLNYDDCIFIDNNQDNLIVPDAKGMGAIYFDHNKRDFKSLIEQLKNFGIK